MSYLYQYLLFLAQAATVAVVLVLVLAALFGMSARRGASPSGRLQVTKVNEVLEDSKDLLRSVMLDKGGYKQLVKQEEKARKTTDKAEAKANREALKAAAPATPAAPAVQPEPDASTEATAAVSAADPLPGRARLYLIDFEGDLEASRVDALRREITALLTVASTEDEVLLRLESPGGLVHAYGLAASQLARIRRRGIPLTVAVDKVAASGGYMMACVANRILAAPFAVIGSIGVVAQLPNVHRLLKKNDVDFELFTAGRYKRTVTVFGENTEEGRAKFREELEMTHELFQSHIRRFRPELDVAAVATGEAWYGDDAIERGLIDDLQTSDDYLLAACEQRDVLHVRWREAQRPLDRILERAEAALGRLAGAARLGRELDPDQTSFAQARDASSLKDHR